MLTLQPFSWEIAEEEATSIHCWALDEQDQTHLIRITDFPVTCLVELPLKVENNSVHWLKTDVDKFVGFLMNKLQNSSLYHYTFSYMERLYGYSTKKYPIVQLYFSKSEDIKALRRVLAYPIPFANKGRAKPRLWEDRIPHLYKFLTRIQLGSAQWFGVDQVKLKVPEESISRLSKEFIVSYKDIKPLTDIKTITHPKIFAFDIEANSENILAFPDADKAKDVCFIISIDVQRLGLPNTRKKYALVLGDCDPIEGVEIRTYKLEKDLLLDYADILLKEDPDIISGYNHHGFDNEFMDLRMERTGEKWPELGRIKGVPTKLESKSWSSSAYGVNELKMYTMDGRISIDMLTVIKREYKLMGYDLNTSSMHFLGRGKHDVHHTEIFLAHQGYRDNPCAETKAEITRITKYCVQDSTLVIDLAERLSLWLASIEMANVVGVPIADLYLRGQQIRTLSNIYRVAHREGYFIDFREALNVVFTGGSVCKPQIGIHDYIPCYDFNSLYPTIMDEENVDHTTIVFDPSIPDEMCNVIEFDQLERPKKISDKVYKDDFDRDIDLKEDGILVHRKIRFIKKEYREGVIPKIVRYLVDKRKEVKDLIKPLELARKEGRDYDKVLLTILDKRQLALKVTANSMFGFLGAHIGKLPLIEGAMAITAKGRQMKEKVEKVLIEEYGAEIVYGDTDSVMPKFTRWAAMSPKEKMEFSLKTAEDITSRFGGRVVVEMEKVMRILCFSAKIYIFLFYDLKTGMLINDSDKKVEAKGNVLARRDGTEWVRKNYRKISFDILNSYSKDIKSRFESMKRSFSMIVDMVLELTTGQVRWQELAKMITIGSNYKSETYQVAVLAKRLTSIGRPAQVGDRLKCVVCDIEGETKVGPKLRTAQEYTDSQETATPLRLDTNYYLENAMKKIDQLFQFAYHDLLENITEIGYKPRYSRKHYVSLEQPMKMLARMLEEQIDITLIKDEVSDQLDFIVKKKLGGRRRIVIKK